MKFYLARHGQTDWNKEMRAQGRKDIPLNETGIKQAEELRDKIKDIEFTAVYASPLKRAAETAKIAVGDRYEIIYDDRLMERSGGDFEGQVIRSWADIPGSEFHSSLTLAKLPNNVEPLSSVLQRVKEFLSSLKQQYSNDAAILIIGHNGVFKAFDWILTEHTADDTFGKNHLGNAEVRQYEF